MNNGRIKTAQGTVNTGKEQKTVRKACSKDQKQMSANIFARPRLYLIIIKIVPKPTRSPNKAIVMT
jgi:serine/threonine-protein kinase RIO1